MTTRELLGLRAHRSHLVALTAALACGSATAPSVADVETQRALWTARHVTSYAFEYEETGFFICCITGVPLRVVVRNDSIASTTLATTGQPCSSPCPALTVDELFDFVIRYERNGWLGAVTFDPFLHYPTRIELKGPPDTGRLILATDFQPVP